MFVRTGEAITLYNRCSSDETAVQRANQIRQLFRRSGWRDHFTNLAPATVSP